MSSIESGAGVYLITVTHGDRYNVLIQTLKAALETGVEKIILVENGCAPESKRAIQVLGQQEEGIDVVSLPENIGSAGAYKAGIARARMSPGCEYLWFLDDDNLPESEALFEILQEYEVKSKLIAQDQLALASFRPEYSVPEYRLRSFVGFHIADFPKRVFRFIQVLLRIDPVRHPPAKPLEIPCSPYGGLFFSKEILSKIGYPNEDLVLYADDTEYTMRIVGKGGHIFLVPTSIVRDLLPAGMENDGTKHARSGSTMLDALTAYEEPRIYYRYRNSAYVGRNIAGGDGTLIYLLNKAVYLVALATLALFLGRWNRFQLILRAIRDGEAGRLGRVEEFKLTGFEET